MCNVEHGTNEFYGVNSWTKSSCRRLVVSSRCVIISSRRPSSCRRVVSSSCAFISSCRPLISSSLRVIWLCQHFISSCRPVISSTLVVSSCHLFVLCFPLVVSLFHLVVSTSHLAVSSCLCKSKESTYSVIIKQGNEQRDYVTVKVIPFNCIAHPFFASFFGVISARTNAELDRFSMKAEQSREISGRFLQNELGESIS